MQVLSLFSSGGIGDLAIKKLGSSTIVANELIEARSRLFRKNFPDATMISGCISEKMDQIVSETKNRLQGKTLDMVLATPPCQGMSKNGQGKLLHGIRAGKKPPYDIRNQLIVPTMNIVKEMSPHIVFFENVPEMVHTVIQDDNGNPVGLIDYIKTQLGDNYVGGPEVVQFADYGIPQRRTRLITIFTKHRKLIQYYRKHHTFLPETTHCQQPTFLLLLY